MRLSGTALDPLLSAYLTDGVHQDSFRIDSIDVDGPDATAKCRMTSAAVSKTDSGGFHLTAPTVFRMAGQLLVVHGQVLFGFESKQVEVWVKEHALKHRRPVRHAEGIEVRARITSWRTGFKNPEMFGFSYEVTIEDDAVVGHGQAFFDLGAVPDAASRIERAIFSLERSTACRQSLPAALASST